MEEQVTGVIVARSGFPQLNQSALTDSPVTHRIVAARFRAAAYSGRVKGLGPGLVLGIEMPCEFIPRLQSAFMRRIPLWMKVLWTVWVVLWAPLYWRQYGAQNFLYFCDLGNVLIMVALWAESALLFSWQAAGLLVFQTLYMIDLIGAAVSGHHLIGGTEYMFDPHIPLLVRLLSLFHVVTPPLLLWAIWKLGYDPRGWKLATLVTWIVIPINYCWRPQYNINWARGLFMQQHVVPGVVYLLAYLTLVPLLIYYPTHLLLSWWFCARRGKARSLDSGFRPRSG